jgi:hypothetical protein
MTLGSTSAAPNDSPDEAASKKSTTAAPRRILTRRSSNCLRMRRHMGVPVPFVF